MGVAYYIEVDDEELEVADIDGKAVAKAMEALTALAEELGVEPLEAYMGQSMDDVSDMLGEDIELAEGVDGGATWFEPAAGLATVAALTAALTRDPKRLKKAEAVLEDLESYRVALQQIADAGAKWHLAIDI